MTDFSLFMLTKGPPTQLNLYILRSSRLPTIAISGSDKKGCREMSCDDG